VTPALVTLRQQYREAVAAAIQRFGSDRDPTRLLREVCGSTDRVLKQLWRDCEVGRDWCLVAVGGYGRRDLFPHSDVDLLILTGSDDAGASPSAIESFVTGCWDIGLQIGHSVRSHDACLEEAQQDLTVRSSLIERRYLTGSRPLLERLSSALDALIEPHTFLAEKTLEMRQRHARFEDTPYSLEPNVKESPGGLRDLQVLLWVARAAGLGRSWAELHEAGIVTPVELRQLRYNERQIKRIRAALHTVAGRREDRLVFDLQAQVAQVLGFGSMDRRQASEELMQRYYWAAKAVVQLNTIVLQNLGQRISRQSESRPLKLNETFNNRGGLLDIAEPDCFERDPSAMLRAFLALCEHRELTGMSADTLRALWNARFRIDARFRADPAHRALFLAILQSPHGVTRALRRMNQWSILGRYLPVFRKIVGRMQHDLFHVYTVDQHILMVVRNLRRFAMPEHAHEYPHCSQLMSEFERPWRLVVAALFHDIAKGRGGDHSALGRVDVRRFCRAHGLSPADTGLIEFLVEHHLTLSSVAQKQDLSDPAVIDRFARTVGTPERLIGLYLLTVADIRGTSPKVWNAWKGKLLEDLYRSTMRRLRGERPSEETRVDHRQAEAVRLLNLLTIPRPRYETFWSRLDISYFLRTEPADIAWHTRILCSANLEQGPFVSTRLSPIGEGFQIMVHAADQPDLFARICGYLDRANLSVLDAQIHTTPDGWALDSFLVINPNADAHYRDILSLVETQLRAVLTDDTVPLTAVRGRPSRRSRFFPVNPEVTVKPDENGRHYLLSISANDQTGLLYRIAEVLKRHAISLHSARIMTLGERVEDVLVIDGPSLAHTRSLLRFETELLEALGR
jgi:[protein-PII] uridylyltransferase